MGTHMYRKSNSHIKTTGAFNHFSLEETDLHISGKVYIITDVTQRHRQMKKTSF